MSRIFDALQRSGTEQTGVEYSDMVSVAAAISEAPPSVVAEVAAEFDAPDNPPVSEYESTSNDPVDEHANISALCPSLEVCVAPSSRLVFFTQPESLPAEKFRFL